MCGITGFCDFTKSFGEDVLQLMTDELAHRGPDFSDIYVTKTEGINIGLGHRRLSILDLSEKGNQPMHKESISIVFNGEIYNFNEIRDELINEGVHFDSHSDTEVILSAYKRWGIDSVNKFVGMFAFVLFDSQSQTLYLVRDRAGVKPLYYYKDGKSLIFGSELKSFHKYPNFEKDINTNSLALYLKYSYVPTPHCIYNNTFKINPGHYVEFDISKRSLRQIKYWDVVDLYNKPKIDISYEEAVNETQKKLEKAFKYRMVSDVPVGVFLSGGYDSTAVASILQKDSVDKIKTFTIGFHEAEYNEAEEAKKIASYLGTDHTELYCTPKDAIDILDDLPFVFDEPFADNSVVPTMLLSKLARSQVKVALSGDGGDEIFGGYDKFVNAIKYTEKLPHSIMTSMSKLMGLFNPEKIPFTDDYYNFVTRYDKLVDIWSNPTPTHALEVISQFTTNNDVQKIMNASYEDVSTFFDIEPELLDSNDSLNKLLAIDYKTFLLDNNLTKIDRSAMFYGLEGREPFLDQNIIEYVSSLPSEYKIRNGVYKSLLKDVVHKYVPSELMNRPKMPFLAPLSLWLKDEMKKLVIDYINPETLGMHNYFKESTVIKLRDDFLNGQNVSMRKIWNILLFQIWYEKWN